MESFSFHDLVSNIDTIDHSISPQDLFKKYISTRIPVKISNFKKASEFTRFDHKLETLKDTCVKKTKETGADIIVKVEERKDIYDRFGKGNEKQMKFIDFIDEMIKCNDLLYMTTQELLYNEDDCPSIISPPINQFMDKLPITPIISGHLIPSNINLWIGCNHSNIPSSSGLHHDYHDNIYILLNGIKHFTLIHYTHMESLYPVGEVVKVHSNGRINYKGMHYSVYINLYTL